MRVFRHKISHEICRLHWKTNKFSFDFPYFGGLCKFSTDSSHEFFKYRIESHTSSSTVEHNITSCQSIEDVCELFKKNRQRLSANDLIILLSRIIEVSTKTADKLPEYQDNLWIPTPFCLIPLARLYGRINILDTDKRVSEIYTDIIHKFDCFTPTQVLYINKFGDYIKGYHNNIISSSSEKLISSQIWNLDTDDLCRAGSVLASKSNDIEFVKLFTHVVLGKLIYMSHEQRGFIFKIMANSKKCSSLFLDGVSRYVLKKDFFSDSDTISILSGYAKRQSSCPSVFLKALLEKSLALDFSKINQTELYDLIWASCKYSNGLEEIFSRAHDLLLHSIDKISAKSLSMLIWSFGNSKFDSQHLFNALEKRAIDVSDNMTPSNIAICVYWLSRKLARGTKASFHENVEGVIISNIAHFNGLDLAMLASGYVDIRAGSAALHQCIQESCLKYSDDIPADCITKILRSYATIVGRESLFTSFQFHFLERIHQFPTHELCTVLWSFAVMRFYDPLFWKECIQTINFEDVIDNNRCYLLFPALSIVTEMQPELISPEVLRLLNHTRSSFWKAQIRDFSEETSEQVKRILSELSEIDDICICTDKMGFLVDISFKRNSKEFAVLLYSDYDTFGENNRPTGAMLLKERFLRNRGLFIC
ncbi:hypothetical protein BEWA_006210 [Theileria equi strain WA]|uniref:RAP domain-containing protein n=1 Tax=Theileria equi strain WA TaxID=1537102 RepID=L0B030_THEEQ|nr:hypothetical protein BEWA_006210 [Theileria equi strain WA]AFZ81212.1 hypothetical protein BEWA_006210 [Theileria equi strain WA]|eukprot:XP_004830878.1 hypothetical protein BEWA_006210 [Theileria equi strain WA]